MMCLWFICPYVVEWRDYRQTHIGPTGIYVVACRKNVSDTAIKELICVYIHYVDIAIGEIYK